MIYRTKNMEAAVIALASDYRLICVRTHHRSKLGAIRFRANSIANLTVNFYRPSVDGDGSIRRWHESGGVLINPTPRCEPLPTHEVHLFSECPASVKLMQEQSRDALMTVIYEPPVWDAQIAAIERMFPSKAQCKRVFDTLHKLAIEPLGERYSAIVKFTNLARWKVPVCTDAELAEYASVPLADVGYMRDLVVRVPVTPNGRGRRIVGITPRFPPTDPALMEVWSKIKERPDEYKEERFFDRHDLPKLGGKVFSALLTLKRSGSISVQPDVYVYPLRRDEPDWWGINRTHETALANFKEIRAMVKKAKEL